MKEHQIYLIMSLTDDYHGGDKPLVAFTNSLDAKAALTTYQTTHNPCPQCGQRTTFALVTIPLFTPTVEITK